MSKSDVILQIKADILGIPVIKLSNTETGTVGTAILGSVAIGMFKTYHDAINALVKTGKEFLPDMEKHNFYKKQFEIYKNMYYAVNSLMGDNEDEKS